MKLKWNYSDLNHPMARAKGLGSAHGGLHHWNAQRLTAITNIPLFLWALWSGMTLAAANGADYETVQAFFAQPCNAILMILFLISVFYHMKLGLQVVIEDYIHGNGLKIICLIALNALSVALAVLSIFSVAKMAFF
ncbi:MAG: succinate dehydrogenase, hydrophobic membrane anchor protein [Alphaproteobacteria bacterium]|nr:succinate dehydrogenase, hydrophobic membrane anchor protein [Alphaproteobacteria bacterium]